MGLDITKLGGVFKKTASKIDIPEVKMELNQEQLKGLDEAIKKVYAKKLDSDTFQKIVENTKNIKTPDVAKLIKKLGK